MKVDDSKKNVQVVVRVRPLSRREREQNQRIVVKVEDSTTLLFDPDEDEDEFFYHGAKQSNRDITKKVNKKLTMDFDEVFGNEASNQDIFESVMKPLVNSVIAGYNCSVFVYGATGAGKTFTMLGNYENPGITYLTSSHLFDQIETMKNDRKIEVGVSYLEVYNELVMNLLTKGQPLKLREDCNGVVVGGLTLKPIHNANELLQLLTFGNRNRTQHPTDANEESSRSHAIFQIHIRMTDKITQRKTTVKLSMIDLAGSERAASTKGIGTRFKEGANINKSLLALGNCINRLADGSKHIPYRDSNLTRIIKDSLGGNCHTLMIANVSPSSLTYEDTYNTLKYASRAKKIRTSLKLNVCKANLPKELIFKKLTEQQNENEKLKQKMREMELQFSVVKPAEVRETVVTKVPDLSPWYKRIDKTFDTMKHTMERYYQTISKEKCMRFRLKIDKNNKDMRQILVLNEIDGIQSSGRFEASVNTCTGQLEKLKSEISRLKTELYEQETDIKKLRKEIRKTEFESVLLPYISAKECELDAVKANVKVHHGMKFNMTYQKEYELLMNDLTNSLSLLQDNYILLRATNNLTVGDRERYENIKKHLTRRRGVTFSDEQSDGQEEDLANLSMNVVVTGDLNRTTTVIHKRPIPNCDTDDEECPSLPPNHTYKKPSRQLFKNNETLPPPQPLQQPSTSSSLLAVPNLNETQTLSSSSVLAHSTVSNGTISSSKAPIIGRANGNSKSQSNLLRKAVLAENNANNVLYNRVTKINSKPKFPTKLGVNINKENKKFSPIRLKLSPKLKTPRMQHHLKPSVPNRHRTVTATSDNILSSVKKKF